MPAISTAITTDDQCAPKPPTLLNRATTSKVPPPLQDATFLLIFAPAYQRLVQKQLLLNGDSDNSLVIVLRFLGDSISFTSWTNAWSSAENFSEPAENLEEP